MSSLATKPLTDLQERFVKEYLIDLDATNAAKRAGYKDPNIGRQLITKTNVADAIAKGKGRQSLKLDLKAERVLQEYVRIGFLDPRRIFKDDGTLKNVHEWPDDIAAAIASIETIEEYEGTGKNKKFKGIVRKIRFWPKVEALRDMGKHIGLFPDRPSQNINVNVENLTDAERLERLRQYLERLKAGGPVITIPGNASGDRQADSPSSGVVPIPRPADGSLPE